MQGDSSRVVDRKIRHPVSFVKVGASSPAACNARVNAVLDRHDAHIGFGGRLAYCPVQVREITLSWVSW
jgi:hypothetical protein